MTITKKNPESEFWKSAAEASRRVEKYPPWKLGILVPTTTSKPATVVQTEQNRTSLQAATKK